jgi:hypothetical protein
MSEKAHQFTEKDTSVLKRKELYLAVLNSLKNIFCLDVSTKSVTGRTTPSVSEASIVAERKQGDIELKFKVEILQFSQLVNCALEVRVRTKKTNYTLYDCKFNFERDALDAHVFSFVKEQLVIASRFLDA